MKKPLIGLVPLVDVARDSYWMLPGYMQGLTHSGGIPVMLPLTEERDQIAHLVDVCDGFLFTGGQDVTPSLYGEQPDCRLSECCPQRDVMETELLHQALEADKPVFGICRGIQLINAVLGGSLYQDLPTQHPSSIEHHQTPPYDRPAHLVSLTDGSPIRDLLGNEIMVNSYHHQAVKEVAPTLSVAGIAPDGIVEAVWMPDRKYVWAVQWHPEFYHKAHLESVKLFESFIHVMR